MVFSKIDNIQPRVRYIPRSLQNTDFLAILIIMCVAFLANIAGFKYGYYPRHDTLTVYQFFSYFYSEIIHNKEIPLWLPYTAYGIPSDSYLIFSFGPFQYLTLFIGYIFKIENTLRLFVLSLIFDSAFLMFGAYLFLKHILRDKLPVIIAVTFIGLIAQYDVQLYWNFKILLPIPISLYFAHKFTETLNPAYVIAGIANLLLWSFGSLAYVMPLQFYTISCYCFFLIVFTLKLRDINKNNIRNLYERVKFQMKNRKNQICCILLFIIIGLCISIIITIQHVVINQMTYSASAGRELDLKVSVHSYIHHGGYIGWGKILEMLNGIPYCDNFLLPFTGIVCISFAIIGIFSKNKTKSHIALIMATLFIIAFSVKNTYVARIIYYLPGMNLFRHIAYVITIGKVFVIMLAGFGIQTCLDKNNKSIFAEKNWLNFIDKLSWKIAIPAILAIISIMSVPWDFTNSYSLANLSIALMVLGWAIFSIIYKINNRSICKSNKAFCIGLIIIGILEILQYNNILQARQGVNDKVTFDKLLATKSIYQPKRIHPQKDVYFSDTGAYYGISGDYLQKDFIPSLRQDLISADVQRLLEIRENKIMPIFFGKKVNEFDNKILTTGDPKFDDDLRSFLGNETSKIKLTNDVNYAESEEDTLATLPNASLDRNPIITAHREDTAFQKIKKNIIPLYTVTNTYFSSNKHEFLINNFNDTPLWLIYTDAINKHWHAYIDGINNKIFPANLAFKAIQIPPGSHKLSFVFHKSILLYKIFFIFQILLGFGLVVTIVCYPFFYKQFNFREE